MEQSEREINMMKGVAAGESGAITELYNTYFDSIYKSIFNQVDRNQQAAQDIVQDTFIAAIESAKNYKARSTIKTWIYGISHKKVADYYRKKQSRAKNILDNWQDREEILNTNYNSCALDESIVSKVYIKEILDKMPLHYRQALLLKYIDKMSMVEISIIMKRSIKSVEGILSRARADLRDSIKEMEQV